MAQWTYADNTFRPFLRRRANTLRPFFVAHTCAETVYFAVFTFIMVGMYVSLYITPPKLSVRISTSTYRLDYYISKRDSLSMFIIKTLCFSRYSF